MENEMKIHSQLDETKLKLDSSSLYYEVGPTLPALAQRVSERSLPVLYRVRYARQTRVSGSVTLKRHV